MKAKGRYMGEKGVATILIVGVLVVFLIFFLVLAIDFAYIYVVRGQMQNAADSAALAGAAIMECDGFDLVAADARAEAIKFAATNFAGGEPVTLVTDNSNALSDSNDITVGYWDGTTYTPGITPVNAFHVRPQRKDGLGPGQEPVGLFFGRLVGRPFMEVSRLATAEGCIKNLTPISVNEYWMGDSPLGSCSPATYDPGRDPYGRDHVYPNSFVRPPCSIVNGAINCSSPANGNMTQLQNITDCDGLNPTSNFDPNGPLLADCSGSQCDGRPPGKPRAGRVFAVVGGNARGNASAYNIFGLIDLDRRNNNSSTGPTWYKVSGDTYTVIPSAGSNPDKAVVAGYIANGRYPHQLPTSVEEVYQPGYTTVTTYNSSQPYASTSYFKGQGVVGNDVKANFYDGGNYSGGKYAPGKKLIVAVYDGIVGDSGNQARTTIVGFTVVTIFGYGNSLSLNGAGEPVASGTQNTLYGYIENLDDSLKRGFDEVPPFSGRSKLVE